MEIIELSGYSEREKTEIASRYLVPKQIVANGITPKLIQFPEPMIKKLINDYTAENGVRELE